MLEVELNNASPYEATTVGISTRAKTPQPTTDAPLAVVANFLAKSAPAEVQAKPNTLKVKWLDQPMQVYRTGTSYMSDIAKANTRTPSGHPEGYLEAFANLYKNFALTLNANLTGEKPTEAMLDFPTVVEGVRGMAFIENVVASSKSDQKWYDFKI